MRSFVATVTEVLAAIALNVDIFSCHIFDCEVTSLVWTPLVLRAQVDKGLSEIHLVALEFLFVERLPENVLWHRKLALNTTGCNCVITHLEFGLAIVLNALKACFMPTFFDCHDVSLFTVVIADSASERAFFLLLETTGPCLSLSRIEVESVLDIVYIFLHLFVYGFLVPVVCNQEGTCHVK